MDRIIITDVEYVKENILNITFNNDMKFDVNFDEILELPAFLDLKPKDNFIQFGLVNGTLEWYNGADLAPEYIYKLALKQNKNTILT